MRKINKRFALITIAILLVVLIVWTIWSNSVLEVNTYPVASNRLPEAFHGFRIAQVSDLHNESLGQNHEKVLSALQACKPDIIAITGDLIDSRDTNVEVALQFVREAVKIAPCYYVTGNHESRVKEYEQLRQGLIELGVVVLEDDSRTLTRDGQSITLLGVNDPAFIAADVPVDDSRLMNSKLDVLEKDDSYKVLLSHRPELMEIYAQHDIDLVLSGHAHGGQFRMPFIGGIFAPGQGFFPEYDGGLYTEGNTNMVVSRGIGNSAFPFRFNNSPEVVVIDLLHAPY